MLTTEKQTTTWIWYPGDFEIWLHREVCLRREERGSIYPPFYRLDSPYVSLKFQYIYTIAEPEEISIAAEGRYNVMIDGLMVPSASGCIELPAGEHNLIISVVNEAGLPALFVQGSSVASGSHWNVSHTNWQWVSSGSWDFNKVTEPPSAYRLATMKQSYMSEEQLQDGSRLIDFGKETFGYIQLHGLTGAGKVMLYYGESREEALSEAYCETLDCIEVAADTMLEYTHHASRALRYVRIVADAGIEVRDVSLLYEYLPLQYRGKFRCSNERINQIWNISTYTMHLTTREFFLDGIKRDRWVWSGDAYQSYLINYYSFFNEAVNRRTTIALRGKDPLDTHLNTILDYSFFWMIALYDHYWYTGDLEFVRSMYKKLLGLLDFCRGRANSNGMVEGQPGDWVFVDWADIDKQGELSFQQVLYCRSLEVSAQLAALLEDEVQAQELSREAASLKKLLFETFWDEERGGLLHNRVNGVLQGDMTRYSNMFAILLDMLDEKQRQLVAKHVLKNDAVPSIVTPYMRFFELAALCEVGEQAYVLSEMKSYWGGMLDLGATTFWEKYDPELEGAAQYESSGRPFAKSLCHAWGAGPIYLLGKYFMGVRPLDAGYAKVLVEPTLGGLSWFEGTVPTAEDDEIEIYMDEISLRIRTGNRAAVLRLTSVIEPACEAGTFCAIGDHRYELSLDNLQSEYVIAYRTCPTQAYS